MAAVWIRLRAELRSRWRSWLALAVLAGVAAGLVLATAAGARRTDSAVARGLAATETVDLWVARGKVWGLDVDFDRVERLPQVAQSSRSIDLAFWGRTDAGRPVTNSEVELGAPTQNRDPASNRPKVIAGRAPDPAAADEIFVGHRAADYYDLSVGSTVRMRFATPREVAKIAETGEHDERADPATAGKGPLLTLRVVGIRADVQSEDGFMYITTSPAFYETYGHRVGTWLELTGIQLRRDADLSAFRAGVERIAGKEPFELYLKRTLQAKLQSSIHIQALALWVLATLGGLAALLIVGQALARQTALESSEHPLLRTLGMTRSQLFALGLARVIPVGLVAGALAAGIAVALSPLAPIGAARTAEPDPGLALDLLVVGTGGAATVVLVLVAALLPAWRAARGLARQGQPRPSAAVGLLGRVGLSPSSVAGVRMALEPGRGRTAVPVRSTLLAAIVGVTAIASALTITASADRLLETPRLYGHNWDAVIGNGAEPKYPARFVAGLRADRSVAQLAAGTQREVRVEGKPTGVLGMDSIRGSLSPPLLEGRPPAGPDEIVLGTKTAGALGAEIGEQVKGRIGGRAGAFRVVGRGVLPEVSIGSGLAPVALGEGAAMTFEGLRRLDPEAPQNIFLLDLSAWADRRATLARLEREASAVVPSRPAEVGNWGRVSGFPYLLAALIAALAAAILAHALVTSIRRRRRDFAILKTLGFERHDLRATVAWQASTVAAIGLLVGLPLGVGIGRFAWNLFAEELGVVPEPVAPLWPGLLVIPATLLLANLVALLPGRIAAGTRPAAVLRAE